LNQIVRELIKLWEPYQCMQQYVDCERQSQNGISQLPIDHGVITTILPGCKRRR
jgi:hypothetical protein